MSTNRSKSPAISSRRKARRRTSVRRGWWLQRLEPRCVMAADLIGGQVEESPWADDSRAGLIEDVPSLISSERPVVPADESPQLQPTEFDEPDVELSIDRLDDVVDEIAVDQRGSESIELVDLLSARAIDLQLRQYTTVVFTWDVSQLDQLLGRSDALVIHVVYDASRWQAPIDEQVTAEFDLEDSQEAGVSIAQTQLLFGSTLKMLSLADQSVQIQIDIQPGNVDEGTLPLISITLTDPNSSTASGEKWTTEEYEWLAGFDSTPSIAPNERWDIQGSKVSQVVVDNTLGLNPADDGGAGYSSTDNAMIGEESGAQPSSEGDSEPLPESRRESPDRSPRTTRRTLDLRPTGAVSSMAPLASRTAVTPESLATQAAVAGVYESESSTATARSRWLLDPKPARLQVATFLLSRSADSSRSVAVRSEGTRSVDQPEPATGEVERKSSRPTVRAESGSQYVVSQGSNVETASESAIDGTVTRNDDPIEESYEELEEAVRELPAYASIVDRLLGSPASLVAVLGLTAIVRFTDPEEATQHLG